MSTTHLRAALHSSAALRPVERLVLIQLGGSADPHGCAFPSVGRLAAAANVSDSTVLRALQHLVELQLIERVRSHAQSGAASRTAYRMIGGQA